MGTNPVPQIPSFTNVGTIGAGTTITLSAEQYANLIAQSDSKKVSKGYGATAPFPPLPSSSGYVWYYLGDQQSSSGKACIVGGWKAAERHFAVNRSWNQAGGDIRGFVTLDEAAHHFFTTHPRRWTVQLSR